MVCLGLSVHAYLFQQFVFLKIDMYGIWKIDINTLQTEEVSEKEFESIKNELKEVNYFLGGYVRLYPRTDVCTFYIPAVSLYIIAKYDGSSASAYLEGVTRSPDEAKKIEDEVVEKNEVEFF